MCIIHVYGDEISMRHIIGSDFFMDGCDDVSVCTLYAASETSVTKLETRQRSYATSTSVYANKFSPCRILLRTM